MQGKIKKKAKQSFIKLADFLKRIVMSLEKISLSVKVKGIPKFLKDIFSEITKKSNKLIIDPFTASAHPESLVLANGVVFTEVRYYKTFSYSTIKSKKMGRVKRKIRRKILATNNVID
jgi:hypothetical protein